MTDWDEDSDQLTDNLRQAYRHARDQALARDPPGVALARDWHGLTMAGLDVPDRIFGGGLRGAAGLEGCEVHIGGRPCVPASLVAEELRTFEQRLARAVSALDQLIPHGGVPATRDRLNAVIELCAWVHAEWVRTHPFANGNGRTARIWTAFVAMRYGLPPFVRLRPRPDGGYGAACSHAMDGDWAPTAQVFRRMYLDLVAPPDRI